MQPKKVAKKHTTARVEQHESALGVQSEVILVLLSQILQYRKEIQDTGSVDQKIRHLEEKMDRYLKSVFTLVNTQDERSQIMHSDIALS